MSKDRFHFEIPNKNVRKESYEKSGFSPKVDRDNHKEHGLKLSKQTENFKSEIIKTRDIEFSDEYFLQIETVKDVKLKSQKTKIENLGFDLISYSKESESVGLAKIGKSKFSEFEDRLKKYISTEENSGKTYFSPIESIKTIPPESKIEDSINFDSEDEIEIVISLFNTLKPKEIFAINNALAEELRQISSQFKQRKFENGVSSILCTVSANILPKIAEEFLTIKNIKPTQSFVIPQSKPVGQLPNPLSIDNPVSDSSICIIDSGVRADNDIFKNLITNQIQYLPNGTVEPHFDHGSFVASRCLFGDDIDNCLSTHKLSPYCSILDVAVFGADTNNKLVGPNDFDLMSAIEDVVRQHHQSIKVYNLSLGSIYPVKDFEFSAITKLVDYLSKKYKVLFIIAAGNINQLLGDFPKDHFSHEFSRIGTPAESILGLTVGSIAKFTNKIALSEVDYVSPFSKRGPGADMGIKPEIVAHGGNLIEPYTDAPRVSAYGLTGDTNLSVDIGTSFSAPIVSQYAQRLFDLYPNSDPNLVKALLCHFTEKRGIHDEVFSDSLNYTGFGEPIIQNAIQAHNYNAAFIYEGELDQENYEIIKFHVPKSLGDSNPDSKLRVKITITYDPPVNPDNEIEYSESRVSAKLFKPNKKGMKPINISGGDKYNLPWNPIIQFEKSFTRSYFTGEWELRLRLYTRGNVEESYLQDYSVVIEIIDLKESTDVYSDILNEFSSIYKSIKIKVAA